MVRLARSIGRPLLGLLSFVVIVLGEAAIRSTQRHPLSIKGPSIPGTTIHGSWGPDFLWMGKAWWIEVDTQTPLVLKLNHRWIGKIPIGKHNIYENHDNTNTEMFGPAAFNSFPDNIEFTPGS
jgi:hypothetical protein